MKLQALIALFLLILYVNSMQKFVSKRGVCIGTAGKICAPTDNKVCMKIGNIARIFDN